MIKKPDDRTDNVERIQRNIDNTHRNIEVAKEAAAATDNDRMRSDLAAKNERRAKALDGMKHEIKDEADARDKGYK